MTRRRALGRLVDVDRLAEQAAARAAELADAWDHAAPRRPINGHTASCPNRHQGPMRRCGWCRAEALERGRTVINGVVADGSVLGAHPDRPRHPEHTAQPSTEDMEARNGLIVGGILGTRPTNPQANEIRACPRCFAPTTDPDQHCGGPR